MFEKVIQIGCATYVYQQKYVSQADPFLSENIILLYGSDKASLLKLARDILTFTTKIDSYLSLDIEIENIVPPIGEIRFSLNVGKLFPQNILEVMGINNVAVAYGNCHGAALLVSGAYPVLTNVSGGLNESTVECSNLKIVRNSKAMPGDILSKSGLDDHSLVYINEDWCMSMNGQAQYLELHSLQDVLSQYPGTFSTYSNNYHIPMRSDVSEQVNRWYKIYNNGCSFQSTKSEYYPEVKKIYNTLKKLSQGENKFWDSMLKIISRKMPSSISSVDDYNTSSIESLPNVFATSGNTSEALSNSQEHKPLIEEKPLMTPNEVLLEEKYYLVLDVLSGFTGFGNNPWAVGMLMATDVPRNITEEFFQSGFLGKKVINGLFSNLDKALTKLGVTTDKSLIFPMMDKEILTGDNYCLMIKKSVLEALDEDKLAAHVKEMLVNAVESKKQIVEWKCKRLLEILQPTPKDKLYNEQKPISIEAVQTIMFLKKNINSASEGGKEGSLSPKHSRDPDLP